MIWKADPDKVLRFIEENFGLFQQLYRAQLDDNVVAGQAFDEIVRGSGDITVRRMFDYKLLIPQYNDYRLSEPLRQFMAFLLSEFKPLLPEELDKYRISLEELLDRIGGAGKYHSPVLLRERLDALYDEIQRFLDNVESNTGQLLRATQELKTNKDQMTFSERVRKARHLIEHYIEPLSRILDVHHRESIANVLTRISTFVNEARFVAEEPRIADRYTQLHDLLRAADRRMVDQSRIITRELLPLIERLQRESEILNGWVHFLERPFHREVPRLPKRTAFSLTGGHLATEVQFFLEQFIHRPEAVVLRTEAEPLGSRSNYFNRQSYVRRLAQALPVANYFEWCHEALSTYEDRPNSTRFFRICSLAFEEGDRWTMSFSDERTRIRLGDLELEMPVVTVRKNG